MYADDKRTEIKIDLSAMDVERSYTLRQLADNVLNQACAGHETVWVGCWHDGGAVYFDICNHSFDKDEAVNAARLADQVAIYDLDNGVDIKITPVKQDWELGDDFEPDYDISLNAEAAMAGCGAADCL